LENSAEFVTHFRPQATPSAVHAGKTLTERIAQAAGRARSNCTNPNGIIQLEKALAMRRFGRVFAGIFGRVDYIYCALNDVSP
jgi:hypothetical protein